MGYKGNLEQDLDWVPVEEEIGVKRSETFSEVIKTAMRYNVSIYALYLIINLVLQVVNMDHMYVSKSGLYKWSKNIGKETTEEYDKDMKSFVCLKADGKTSETNIGHNQKIRKHHLTIMKEGCKSDPTPKYVNHVESGESGLAMAGQIMTVIENTDSKESLVAIGGGKQSKIVAITI